MLRRSFLAGVVSLPLAGCFKESPPRKIWYRLTLTVETPEGTRVGSSVVRIVVGFNDGPLGGLAANRTRLMVKGEAIVVDLGARGFLFCLLSADGHRWGTHLERMSYSQEYMPFTLFPQVDQTEPYTRYIDRLISTHRRLDLELKHLPLLVRFRDTNDPSSVERVDPFDLAAKFGAGVRLVSAHFEILKSPAPPPKNWWWETQRPAPDLPITEKIDAILPWLVLPPGLGPPRRGAAWNYPENKGKSSDIQVLGFNDFMQGR